MNWRAADFECQALNPVVVILAEVGVLDLDGSADGDKMTCTAGCENGEPRLLAEVRTRQIRGIQPPGSVPAQTAGDAASLEPVPWWRISTPSPQIPCPLGQDLIARPTS